MGWCEPWEWLKNSWNSLVDAPIVVQKINSVEDLSEYVPGMTKEEVNQDIEIFNGGSKEDPSIDGAKVETVNTTGDEANAIENWARSVNIEPITVTDAEVDKVREIKEEEAEKERQRDNSQRQVKQNIEVNGVASINGGDLHIKVEENPFRNWNAWDSAAGLGQGLAGYQGFYNDRSSAYKFWWDVGNKSMKTWIELGPIVEGMPFNPGRAPALQLASDGTITQAMTMKAPLVPIFFNAEGNGSKQQEQNWSASNSKGSGKPRFVNKAGKEYPEVVDPRTGKNIHSPEGDLQKVPKDQRVEWNNQTRMDYIKEWYDKGYKTPEGGWAKYDIHHIKPKEYGGDNSFENLVPVERKLHQNEFNKFWLGF